jgi:PAS domain S-box-containing protein
MRTPAKTPSAPPRSASASVPLYAFLPHVDEPVFVITPEGQVCEVSPSAAALLRCKVEEVLDRSCEDWFLEEENLREVIREATETSAPAYAHLTLLPGESDQVPTVGCAQAIPGKDGPLVLLILKPLEVWDREPQLAAEIQNLEEKLVQLQITLGETAKKLAEKSVQLAEERNKTLAVISNMTAGVLALDADGRIRQTNHKAEELLGVSEERLLSHPFAEVVPQVSDALAEVESSDTDALAIRLTLAARTLHVDSSPIRDPEGNSSGRVVLLHDRTQEEQLNRMREELVSVVSHEMRGPLTTIKGYLQLILRGEAGPLDVELDQILRMVSENAQRLAALIDDLLDLSHLESGQVSLQKRPVNVTALLYCAYCDLQRQAEEKGVGLLTEVPDEPLRVFGDERRLLQVLSNLGSNAVKFTPACGEVTLWGRAEGEKVVFGVTDTGIGISEEDQKQLFTKFFRSREATRREIPGSGLGLCITRRIVEGHGGTVEIESTPGQGTAARVTLSVFSESLE